MTLAQTHARPAGATLRSGSITAFIRERGSLPPHVIVAITRAAQLELLEFHAAQAALPANERTPIGDWVRDLHRAAEAVRHPDHDPDGSRGRRVAL